MSVCSNVMFAGRMTLAAGYYHTCILSAAGGAACWGQNGAGQTSVPSIATSGPMRGHVPAAKNHSP